LTAPPLVSTKWIAPPLGPGLLERPRLLRLLDAGLRPGNLLTLACAPPGYGKTTLLSAWWHAVAAGLRPQDSTVTPAPLRCAWLTLDQGDDDLARFLAYLAASLQAALPGAGSGMLAALRAPRPMPPQVLATLLINELSARPERLLWVLDDYHAVQAQPVHDFMAFLIDHQPAQLCLVAASRGDPPFPLARLRARGQLTELRQADLCFTPDEAAQFLNECMQLGLDAQQVQSLEGRTEGWITGLRLAAASLRGVQDVQRFVTAFSGAHDHVADYLTDEVLARQPQALRRFLLQTSILERLSGMLCAAVTGEPDAPELLESLREANLFLVPLDHQREWYRYHALFADLLSKRLAQASGYEVAELHRRASRWFQAHAFPAEAIAHALAAGDCAEAARLVAEVGEATLARGEAATALHWLEALPAQEKDRRPILWVLHALALALRGLSMQALVPRLQKLRAEERALDVQGELATLQSFAALLRGDSAQAICLAEQALEQLGPQRSFFVCLAQDSLGMARTLDGDTAGAIAAFEQAAETASRAGSVMMQMAALSNAAGLRYLRGGLRAAQQAYERIVALADEHLGKRSPMTGKAVLGLGELARERNDLDAALRYLTDAADLLAPLEEVGPAIARLSIARVKADQGQWEAAQAELDQARRLARASTSTALDDQLIETAQARFWMSQGALDRAGEWVKASGLLQRPLQALAAGAGSRAASSELAQSSYFALAQWFLLQGQAADAVELLGTLLQAAQAAGNLRRVIAILARRAVALHAAGDAAVALQELKRALELGEPEGFVRTFLDEGQPMAQLLYLAIERGHSPAYAGKLLAALSREPTATPQQPSRAEPTGPGVVEALSQRELEVLALLAEGLSNREISARLYIALSTVKGHTANIYGKLGVRSRTQALAAARRLGLLPPR